MTGLYATGKALKNDDNVEDNHEYEEDNGVSKKIEVPFVERNLYISLIITYVLTLN